jgi:hypothetical protein
MVEREYVRGGRLVMLSLDGGRRGNYSLRRRRVNRSLESR